MNTPYYDWGRYRGSFTVTQLGAGNEVASLGLQLTVNNGNLLLISSLAVVMSDQDVGVEVQSTIQDSESNNIVERLFSGTLDDNRIELAQAVNSNTNGGTVNIAGAGHMPLGLSESDLLEILTLAAIDASTTFIILIRGYLRGDLPSITEIEANTVTTNYNTVD